MKKIYINPGHSDKDPGAVGYETERKLNVLVSQHMNNYLLTNYECETRINPGTMSALNAICTDANNWGADLFVSNHFNAGGGDGYEALVFSQKNVAMGEIFAKHVKAVGQNLRLYGAAPGVKIRPDLTVLAKTYMPAVLNEGAFVDNKKDISDWNDDGELKVLGEAYAKAAAEYLGLKKKTVAPAPVTEKSTMELNVLRKDATGDDVKAMQLLLIGYGYKMQNGGKTYGADGSFGAATENALRAFQKDNGLTADGVCGPLTWAKLLGA